MSAQVGFLSRMNINLHEGRLVAPDKPHPLGLILLCAITVSALSTLGPVVSFVRFLDDLFFDAPPFSTSSAALSWTLAGLLASASVVLCLIVAGLLNEMQRLTHRRRDLKRLATALRQSPPAVRRWVFSIARRVDDARAVWRGPGVLCVGAWPDPFPVVSSQPLEGDLLVRVGGTRAWIGPDGLAHAVLAAFALSVMLLAFFSGMPKETSERTHMILLGFIALCLIVRCAVGWGLVMRGWWDAWIDAEAIEFVGPWRFDRFLREDSVAVLTRGGLFYDLVVFARDGRRVRLMLTHSGAARIVNAWGGRRADF